MYVCIIATAPLRMWILLLDHLQILERVISGEWMTDITYYAAALSPCTV